MPGAASPWTRPGGCIAARSSPPRAAWRRRPYPWSGAPGSSVSPICWPSLPRGASFWATRPAWCAGSRIPRRGGEMTDALGIAHPEIRLARPADPTGWLCKRTGGAGGGHVRRARHRPPRGRGWYWQRWSAGVPVSALLLGSGGDARVLAMGRQITAPLPGRRYRFGGMVVPAGISPTAGRTLERAALALAAHCRLQGLASVDALVAGDAVRVLELNPRPGGSLDAYGAALGRNLFALHVAACRDRTLPEPQATIRRIGLADRLCRPHRRGSGKLCLGGLDRGPDAARYPRPPRWPDLHRARAGCRPGPAGGPAAGARRGGGHLDPRGQRALWARRRPL